MEDVPEPAQRLAPAARWAWRASWLGAGAVAVVIALSAGLSGLLVAAIAVAALAGDDRAQIALAGQL